MPRILLEGPMAPNMAPVAPNINPVAHNITTVAPNIAPVAPPSYSLYIKSPPPHRHRGWISSGQSAWEV